MCQSNFLVSTWGRTPSRVRHCLVPVLKSLLQTPTHLTIRPMFAFNACPQALSDKFPLTWSKDEVEDWLKWCMDEFSLGGVELRKFSMNGKALCLLTKEGFQHRAPYAGDVLHELLQKLLEKGLHLYQSSPSMQMKASTSANEAIALARHLCSTTTTINNVNGPNATKECNPDPILVKPRCSLPPLDKSPSWRHETVERYGDAAITRNYSKVEPLNLKITEVHSENSSDSGHSYQDLVEERETQPADLLSAVHVCSHLPYQSARRSPLGHNRSPTAGQGKSSPQPRGQSKRSLAEDYKRSFSPPHGGSHPTSATKSDTVWPSHPTSATNSDSVQGSHIQATHDAGRVDPEARWTWSQCPDISYFANYKMNKDGELAAVDDRRHRHWNIDAVWKEGHQGLRKEHDWSPVGTHRNGEAEELSNGDATILRDSLIGIRHQHSITGNQCPPHGSVTEGQVMVKAPNKVPVIRTTTGMSNRHSLQNDITTKAANQQPARIHFDDSLPQLIPQRPHEDAPNVPSYNTHPCQYPYCLSPPRVQKEASEGSIYPKIHSGFLTKVHRPTREGPLMSSREGCSEGVEGHYRQKGECRLLWKFLVKILNDDKYTSCICWVNLVKFVFRIVEPAVVANMWGLQKGRINMTYEKLSRALRYYYKANILCKVPGQKLTYRFLQDPEDIANAQRFAKSKKVQTSSTEGGLTTERSVGSEKDEELSDAESASSDSTVTVTPTDDMATVTMEMDSKETDTMEISVKKESIV